MEKRKLKNVEKLLDQRHGPISNTLNQDGIDEAGKILLNGVKMYTYGFFSILAFSAYGSKRLHLIGIKKYANYRKSAFLLMTFIGLSIIGVPIRIYETNKLSEIKTNPLFKKI